MFVSIISSSNICSYKLNSSIICSHLKIPTISIFHNDDLTQTQPQLTKRMFRPSSNWEENIRLGGDVVYLTATYVYVRVSISLTYKQNFNGVMDVVRLP